MLDMDDCEFVAALVASGVPAPVATTTKQWAEEEQEDE